MNDQVQQVRERINNFDIEETRNLSREEFAALLYEMAVLPTDELIDSLGRPPKWLPWGVVDHDDILDQLNSYLLSPVNPMDGRDIWQDVILGLPDYCEESTDKVDTGQNDRFATVDGAIFEHVASFGEWRCRNRPDVGTESGQVGGTGLDATNG